MAIYIYIYMYISIKALDLASGLGTKHPRGNRKFEKSAPELLGSFGSEPPGFFFSGSNEAQADKGSTKMARRSSKGKQGALKDLHVATK